MSYCRFENTAKDLKDCVDNWELKIDSREQEARAQSRIVDLAKEIVGMEEDSKKIDVPLSEGDLQDLINGEEFNWTFDDVDVHLFNEDLSN